MTPHHRSHTHANSLQCFRPSRASTRARPWIGITLGLSVLAASTSAAAATYKVGPARQYTRLGDVAALLRPGDVVEVDGNATYQGGVTFNRHGTSASPIVVRGLIVNGKRPIVSGGTNTIEAAGDYYVFEGLELTGGSSRCFYHHAAEVTLRKSVVRDCPNHGILGADSDSGSLYLEHSEVYRCGSGSSKHQIYIATDESAHARSVFRMDHCFVHSGNGGNNVKTRAERNEIRYNWIEGALYHELELIGPDGQDPALAREDSDVVGNVIFKRNKFYAIRVGGDGTGDTGGRVRFLNNTIVMQGGSSAVFRIFDRLEVLEAHNNIFASADGGAITILNDSYAKWVSGRLVAGSKNYVARGALSTPSEWSSTVSVADPAFVNLGGSDLRLKSSSALVNAGAATTSGYPGRLFPNPLARPEYIAVLHAAAATNDGLSRPNDGKPDIGAYEYASSSGGAGGTGGSGGSGSSGGSGGASGTGGSGSGGMCLCPCTGTTPRSGSTPDELGKEVDVTTNEEGSMACTTGRGGRSGGPLGGLIALFVVGLIRGRRRKAQRQ